MISIEAHVRALDEFVRGIGYNIDVDNCASDCKLVIGEVRSLLPQEMRLDQCDIGDLAWDSTRAELAEIQPTASAQPRNQGSCRDRAENDKLIVRSHSLAQNVPSQI